jgi:hypothetical protein
MQSTATVSRYLNAVPSLSTLIPPTPTPKRGLIALVGKKGTGKHTYLREYYNNLPHYHHLASQRSIEEDGIHPHEQRDYIRSIQYLEGSDLPDPYMFVTYSPYILDALGWDNAHNVIFFHKSSGGHFYRGSMCNNRLANAISCFPSVISLGTFWYSEGEQWLEEYGEDVTR